MSHDDRLKIKVTYWRSEQKPTTYIYNTCLCQGKTACWSFKHGEVTLLD